MLPPSEPAKPVLGTSQVGEGRSRVSFGHDRRWPPQDRRRRQTR